MKLPLVQVIPVGHNNDTDTWVVYLWLLCIVISFWNREQHRRHRLPRLSFAWNPK